MIANLPPLLATYDGADFERRGDAVWRVDHGTGREQRWCHASEWNEARDRLEAAAITRRKRITVIVPVETRPELPPVPAPAEPKADRLTISQAAAAFGVSHQTVYNWIHNDGLACRRVRGIRYVSRQDVAAFLAAREPNKSARHKRPNGNGRRVRTPATPEIIERLKSTPAWQCQACGCHDGRMRSLKDNRYCKGCARRRPIAGAQQD